MYKLKYSYLVIISPLVSPIIILYRLCMNKRSAYNIIISISALIGTGKGIIIYGKGKS